MLDDDTPHSNRKMIWLMFCVAVILFVCSMATAKILFDRPKDDTAKRTDDSSLITLTPAAAQVSCNQAGVQKLVNSVTEKNLRQNLQELVQDNSQRKPNALVSRHVSSPGNQQKVDWVKKQLASYGLTQVNQRFTADGYSLDNIVSRLDGSKPENYYMIGAHIDSTNREDSYKAGEPAPGANDDGSGIVAMMEAARVLKGFQPCIKSSVEFAGFNYEESDSEFGSDYYVKHRDERSMLGLYNMDMVAYGPASACITNYYNNSGRDQALLDGLGIANTKYKLGLTLKNVREADKEHDTDTSNFWDYKLPAVHLYNCEEDPNYHSYHDNLDDINYSQLTKTTKAIIAATAELAMR